MQNIFKKNLFISDYFLSRYTSEKSSKNASKLKYLKSYRSACVHSPKHQHSNVSPGLFSLLQISSRPSSLALLNTFLVAWLDINEYCQCVGCSRDRGNGGNGAGQTGRQCGRLERRGGGLSTCHSLACPVAKQQQTKHTHNSVTTDWGNSGSRRRAGVAPPVPLATSATLPCSLTQPGLFLCQQHIVVCLYSSTFSPSLCLFLYFPSSLFLPVPAFLPFVLSVPLCSNMSLCHLHDDNVFIILTQFQPRRSQTRRETVQQQEEQGVGAEGVTE